NHQGHKSRTKTHCGDYKVAGGRFSDVNILRTSHSGATKTCTGLVRKAGLLPSIKWPSQASAKVAGISSRAMIQCNQTTTSEEKPTGMAMMCSARFRGWVWA